MCTTILTSESGCNTRRSEVTEGEVRLLDLTLAVSRVGPSIPCRDGDAELWFAESPADVEFAKSLCGTCPVRQACLDGARQRREPWGVWGGELFVQGQTVAQKRPRGRPRKTQAA